MKIRISVFSYLEKVKKLHIIIGIKVYVPLHPGIYLGIAVGI